MKGLSRVARPSRRGTPARRSALTVGITVPGILSPVRCPNPEPTLAPKISLRKGSTSYASASEYVFRQGVVADGAGGISSSDVVFTIPNVGGGDLIVSGIALTSGTTEDFRLSAPARAIVAPSLSTTFTLCLDPVAWAPETTANVTITSNDALNGTCTLSLKGFGLRSRLLASDGAAGDRMGDSVALCGDIALVGAEEANAAYVYSRNQGGVDNRGIVKKLLASDRAGNDDFGISLSLSGDTVVVGAMGHRYTSRGAASVFDRNHGGPDNGGETNEILASDGEGGDRFGRSVAIDEDTLVVGADGDNSRQGSAYVFSRNRGGPGGWGEVKKLRNTDGSGGDSLGSSAVIAGDTIIVGAPGSGGWDGGSILTFSRNLGGADNRGQSRRIAVGSATTLAGFGSAVALSNDLLLAGAPGDTVGTNELQGSACLCVP